MNISRVVEAMPKVTDNTTFLKLLIEYCSSDAISNPVSVREVDNLAKFVAEAQCRLLAEEGWTPPIEPIPKHCSTHGTFQDDCQGCQGVTSQYGIKGIRTWIDWPSFNLGQEIMLDQGYRKVPSEEEWYNYLKEFPGLINTSILAATIPGWLLGGKA